MFNSNCSARSRGQLLKDHNPIGPFRGHGDWGHRAAMGLMSKITSKRDARSEKCIENNYLKAQEFTFLPHILLILEKI